MRILVTGAGGFIGSYVKTEIEHRGHECVVFDSPKSVLDANELKTAIADVDGVINLAGILSTSETFGSERETAEVNIIGAINVADCCRAVNIPLVQIGTGHKGQPNPYAITKACAEDLLLVMNTKINIVRAYHAYGPRQKPPAPFGHSNVKKIIPSFVCMALSGRPITINGSGRQVVDLVHAEDVAKVLVDGLEAPYGRTLEAGTGHGMTVNEVVEYILKNVDQVEVKHVPMRKGEPPDAVVVAKNPQCHNPFPYKMEETIEYYKNYLAEH